MGANALIVSQEVLGTSPEGQRRRIRTLSIYVPPHPFTASVTARAASGNSGAPGWGGSARAMFHEQFG